MRNLEDEIVKMKLRRKVISEELQVDVQMMKRKMSPGYLLANALGISPDSKASNTISKVLRTALVIGSTVKGTSTILKKGKSIFSRKKKKRTLQEI